MNRNRTFAYTITVIIIVFLSALFFVAPTGDLYLNDKPIYELNTGWSVILDDEIIEDVTLPSYFEVDKNQWITQEKVISDDFPEDMTLRIRSLMQDHMVFVDDQLIYEQYGQEHESIVLPETSAWLMVELPDDIAGKTLRIMSRTDVGVFSGTINRLDYGSNDALKFEIITKQPVGIIIACVILIFGILFVLVGIVVANYSDMRFLYLGLFSVLIGIWLLSEMDLMQFVTGKRMVIGGISYIVLPLIPLYFLLFLKQVVLERFEKIIYPITGIFFTLFLLNIAFEISGVFHFIEFAIVVNIAIGLVVILIMTLLWLEYKKQDNRDAGRFFVYLLVFAITVLIEIVAFFSESFASISSYSQIGFLLFYVFIILDSLRYINDIIVQEGENNALRKLAYTDILTGGHNRATFEKDVDQWINEGHIMRLVIADMNRLKMINDTYGHNEGDRAIKVFHSCMVEAFGAYGKCYRLGGDEFACIISNMTQDEFEEKKAFFKRRIADYNEGYKYHIEVAMGSDIYEPSDNYEFRDFMHQVDLLMYDDKRNSKF